MIRSIARKNSFAFFKNTYIGKIPNISFNYKKFAALYSSSSKIGEDISLDNSDAQDSPNHQDKIFKKAVLDTPNSSKSDKALLDQSAGKENTIKNILFLCVANSARSQIAEGLAKKILEGIATVQSAGSNATTLNPLAIEVMKEINIDISNQYSKSIDVIDKSKVDIVITLCAEETCPLFIGKTIKLGWAFQDPIDPSRSKQEQIAQLRKVRDILSIKIGEFKEYLGQDIKAIEAYDAGIGDIATILNGDSDSVDVAETLLIGSTDSTVD